ncbi:MAG: endolytic transglycosylase MltG [Defluviitaleaceae bacterium]|nr:endolytic transglycosylase MltG [Defluviitaleaceae bacterium]
MLKMLINVLSFILGTAFNALIFVGFIWVIFTFTDQAFAFGQEFSYGMTREGSTYQVEFILEEDTPVAEVAQMLEDKGIISNALMYRFELMLLGAPEYYRAGTYVLSESLSTTQINARLQSRPQVLRTEDRITIREGWTQRDIALYLEDRGFFTAEEFMYAANHHDFGFAFLEDLPDRPSRLEGYLFPDTYFIYDDSTPVQVITRMLQRFNQVFNYDYRVRARELGLTMDEVVNIAAMIEREVRYPPDRPKVSRVISNRLNIGMPLQIDATVAYALDRHLDRTTNEHTRIASPFNTYYVNGLPWGPISNPGAASINAALFPADGNWTFYVLIDGDTGRHYFTNNFDRHRYMAINHMPRPWLGE